jgi:hypothetical protein
MSHWYIPKGKKKKEKRMADIIKFTIETDGTITTQTDDAISPVNHKNADDFLKYAAELAGGKVTTTPLPHKSGHKHTHIKAGR